MLGEPVSRGGGGGGDFSVSPSLLDLSAAPSAPSRFKGTHLCRPPRHCLKTIWTQIIFAAKQRFCKNIFQSSTSRQSFLLCKLYIKQENLHVVYKWKTERKLAHCLHKYLQDLQFSPIARKAAKTLSQKFTLKCYGTESMNASHSTNTSLCFPVSANDIPHPLPLYEINHMLKFVSLLWWRVYTPFASFVLQ